MGACSDVICADRSAVDNAYWRMCGLLVAVTECPRFWRDLHFPQPLSTRRAGEPADRGLHAEYSRHALPLQCILEVRVLLPHCLVLVHPVRSAKQGCAVLSPLSFFPGHSHFHAPGDSTAALLRCAQPMGIRPRGANLYVPRHGVSLPLRGVARDLLLLSCALEADHAVAPDL